MNVNPMLNIPVNGLVSPPPLIGVPAAPPSSLTDIGKELNKQSELEKGIDFYNKRSFDTLYTEA